MSTPLEIIIGVCAVIHTLGSLFFLMAIWRAVLGKSSVDVKLGVGINSLTKRVETMNSTLVDTNIQVGKTGEKIHRKLGDLDRLLSKKDGEDGTRTD